MSVNSKMTAIADAIRAKTGGTGLLTLDDMAIEIASITGGGGTTLTVTTTEGATVTVTNGSESYTGVGPVAVFEGLSAGTWTVTATLGDASTSKTVEIGAQAVEVPAYSIYGISRNITSSSPIWARTDGAIGLKAVASVGTVAGHSDFDNCYPWSGIQRETLSTGDVMVKIPKFYYKRYREGDVEYIKVADKEAPGFAIHPLFNHGGVENDYAYVGAYKTSSNNRSVSGAYPQASQTRATFRTNAKLKGAGWSMFDVAALSAIQMLILVEFANNNVQTEIGRGYCDGNSNVISTGSCDSVLNLTGIPSGTNGKTDVVWRGIEGLWGNVWEWVDGINIKNGQYWVCNDPTKYADDTGADYEQLTFTAATTWNSAYITAEGLDSGNSHIMLPSAAGSGNEATYMCDACWAATNWRIFRNSGGGNNGSIAGLFTALMNDDSSRAHETICSRLIYIPS